MNFAHAQDDPIVGEMEQFVLKRPKKNLFFCLKAQALEKFGKSVVEVEKSRHMFVSKIDISR